MSKENQKTTSDFDALDPRIKGCSPLIIPKRMSKRKKASRFAKRFFSFLRFTASPKIANLPLSYLNEI